MWRNAGPREGTSRLCTGTSRVYAAQSCGRRVARVGLGHGKAPGKAQLAPWKNAAVQGQCPASAQLAPRQSEARGQNANSARLVAGGTYGIGSRYAPSPGLTAFLMQIPELLRAVSVGDGRPEAAGRGLQA
ncbi:hypothetical protein GCM10010471_29940 [Leucobacter komagatae]